MKNKEFAKNILDKIKYEHIKKIPRWHFLLKSYFAWFLVLLSVVALGIAVSIIILGTIQLEMPIAGRASGGVLRHIILFTPYLWVFLSGLFIILTLYNFKHTKRGYRYTYVLIITLGLAIGAIFGFILYVTGLAERTDNYVYRFAPNYINYKSMEQRHEQRWTQPQKGLLAGVPLGTLIEDVAEFNLVDFTGKVWIIDSSKLDKRDRAIIAVSPKVAIIGIERGDNLFEACRVVPWGSRGSRGQMRKDIMKFAGANKNINERNIFELRSNVCGEEQKSTN